MVALLDDAALVHHDQPVHGRDGRQPVRDGHHRLAFHQPVQAALDRRLDLRVQRAGRLVEQQDRRVLQHHPRDRDPLALAAGQLHAAFADMRVVALATLGVGQSVDEVHRLGAFGGGAHLVLGRVGPAVHQVVAHRAVQQAGVLGDHADLASEAVLRDRGDVLTVDQHPALVHVVEAQQQVDQGRLAGARAADHADLLARADRQRQVVQHGLAAAVAEVDVVEADLAPGHRERGRAGGVLDRDRARQRGDAVLHGADVLEQAGHLPHDPVRDAVQPQRHRRGRRDRADAHLALRPQPDRHAGGGGDQAHRQRMVDDLEAADQPHLPVGGAQEVLHRAAGEAGLAVGVGEQLDGADVGVGVGDAAGHQAARVGLRGGGLAQPGHEVGQRHHVAGQPAQEGQQQRGVEAADHAQHRHEVDRDEDQDVGDDQPALAHRQRRLHQLGRDATGELVLVEAHALGEQVAVEVPAQPHREVAGQALVLAQRLQRDQQRAGQQDAAQQQQLVLLGRPPLRGRDLAEPVDDRAQHREQQRLEGADGGGQDGQHQDQPAHPVRARPDEGEEPLGRLRRRGLRKRIDEFFEPAKHGGLPVTSARPCSLQEPCGGRTPPPLRWRVGAVNGGIRRPGGGDQRAGRGSKRPCACRGAGMWSRADSVGARSTISTRCSMRPCPTQAGPQVSSGTWVSSS